MNLQCTSKNAFCPPKTLCNQQFSQYKPMFILEWSLFFYYNKGIMNFFLSAWLASIWESLSTFFFVWHFSSQYRFLVHFRVNSILFNSEGIEIFFCTNSFDLVIIESFPFYLARFLFFSNHFFSYIVHVHTKSATYSLGWSDPSGPWSGAVTGLWFAGGRGDWLGGGRTWSAHPPPPPAPDETPRCSGSATLDSDRASDGHLPSPPPASAFLWHTLGHRDLNNTKIKILLLIYHLFLFL